MDIKTQSIEKFNNVKRKGDSFIKKHPILSFIIVLFIFLIILFANAKIAETNNQEEIFEDEIVKTVNIYEVENTPYVTAQGQVQKTGVVDIIAQTSGVVQSINLNEGDQIAKGGQIVNLSTNYNGANASSISRRISQKNYQNLIDTLESQLELIEIQRNVAVEVDQNNEELRSIKDRSIKETKDLIDLNQEIVDELNQTISETDSLNTKMLKTQYQSSLNNLKNGLRNLEYEIDGGNPPMKLSGLQRDQTLKQLDIQEKALQLNKDIAKLDLALARVQESLMFPSTPIAGTIEKVHVKQGDIVNPGDLIATISGDDISLEIIAFVTSDIADNTSRNQPSQILIGGYNIDSIPTYISSEVTNDQLRSISYNLAPEYNELLNNEEYTVVRIPIGYIDDNTSSLYIPIDAVHQTQEQNFVYVVKDNVAYSVQVELGTLYGQFIEIISGLNLNDQIILNRNIIDGDNVQADNSEL